MKIRWSIYYINKPNLYFFPIFVFGKERLLEVRNPIITNLLNKLVQKSPIILSNTRRWPKEIKEKFGRFLGKYGVISFIDGSQEEMEFLTLAERLKIELSPKQTIMEIRGNDLYRHPFYYLNVKANPWEYSEDFMDMSRACKEENKELACCEMGAIQKKKVTLAPKETKNFDIMHKSGWFNPQIIIVTPRLKEIILSNNLTGCKFVPCLEKGKSYTDEEVDFASECPGLEKEAKFFQLVIPSETLGPQQVGKIHKICIRCSKCGTVYGFYSDRISFRKDDLNTTDFQKCSLCESENMGQFKTSVEVVIISSKVLRLFLENKIKGIDSYLTSPPIRYGVVEIQ